jgi:uncharacterized protein (DUF488 family)
VKLFTIGFTQRTAEDFFTRLQHAGVRRIIDVRLNNTSQIAGFAKSHDLEYFLKAIAAIEYAHRPEFAPTQEMLDAFKKHKGAWADYEREFNALIRERDIAHRTRELLRDGDCLLCSEFTADQCHRRLLTDHLQQHTPQIEVVHL